MKPKSYPLKGGHYCGPPRWSGENFRAFVQCWEKKRPPATLNLNTAAAGHVGIGQMGKDQNAKL